MEGFIIGLSLTILIVLLIIFILKTKEINRLTSELKKLNREGKIEKLRLSLPNKNIENFIMVFQIPNAKTVFVGTVIVKPLNLITFTNENEKPTWR